MRHLILKTSFSPQSRSAVLADRLAWILREVGDEVETVDLGDLDLPFCDGGATYGVPPVERLRAALEACDTVTLATPVYNYDAGAGARNALALGGKAWTGKAIGLVCAAGGSASYMAVMGLASSLMLGYRCLVVPRFVYATAEAFEDGELRDDRVAQRLEELARALRIVSPAAAELRAERS